MLSFFRKFHNSIPLTVYSKKIKFLTILFLMSAAFLTVNLAQQQQTVKQRAAGMTYRECLNSCSGGIECCEFDDEAGKYFCDTWSMNCRNNPSPTITTCQPNCSGKECGTNGCGGECGHCLSSQACNAQNQCETKCYVDSQCEYEKGCKWSFCQENNLCSIPINKPEGTSCYDNTGKCGNDGYCEIIKSSDGYCHLSEGNMTCTDSEGTFFLPFPICEAPGAGCGATPFYYNGYTCEDNLCQLTKGSCPPGKACGVYFDGSADCSLDLAYVFQMGGKNPDGTFINYPPISYPSPIPTPTPILIEPVILGLSLNAQDTILIEASFSGKLTLYNFSTNTQIAGAPETQIFKLTSVPERKYSADITLAGLSLETYFVVIRKDNMIAKSVFPVLDLIRLPAIPTTTLVLGDLNNDNDIDLTIDYDMFKKCWGQPAVGTCTASDFNKSGGKIDEIDYNTWLRGFATWQKEGQGL